MLKLNHYVDYCVEFILDLLGVKVPFNLSWRAYLFRIAFNEVIWRPFTQPFSKFQVGVFRFLLPWLRPMESFQNSLVGYFTITRLWSCSYKSETLNVKGVTVYKIFGSKVDEDSKVVCLYGHGGGYFGDTLNCEYQNTAIMSNSINMPIYSVKYSMLPETDFKQSCEEFFTVYCYLKNQHKDVVLFGISAGAHLCLRLQKQLMQTQLSKPIGIFMYGPWLDCTFETCGGTVKEDMKYFLEDVLLCAPDRESVYPDLNMVEGDFQSYPPIWLQIDNNARLDFVLSARKLVNNLKQANVDVTYVETENLWHAIPLALGFGVPEVQRVVNSNVRWLSKVLSTNTTAVIA